MLAKFRHLICLPHSDNLLNKHLLLLMTLRVIRAWHRGDPGERDKKAWPGLCGLLRPACENDMPTCAMWETDTALRDEGRKQPVLPRGGSTVIVFAGFPVTVLVYA